VFPYGNSSLSTSPWNTLRPRGAEFLLHGVAKEMILSNTFLRSLVIREEEVKEEEEVWVDSIGVNMFQRSGSEEEHY
jgi:hypothetical protein